MCLSDFLTLKAHPDKEQEDMRFEQQVALVTGAAAFLASKDASFINRAILPVDGGWFAA